MIRAFFVSLALLTPLLAQNAAVEGRVMDESGRPLKNALVRAISQVPYKEFYTETGADGKFVLDDLEPRTYSLTVSHAGYRGNGPVAQLSLTAGQTLAGISITLKRRTELISGRVVDEDGAPVPGARINLRLDDFRLGGGITSRADGSFVLIAGPGRFYLSAEPSGIETSATFRDLSGPQLGYTVTYFPSTPDLSKAAPVVVKPGEQVRNLEIRMTKGRLVHIQGTLVNRDTGTSLANVALALRSLTLQGLGSVIRTSADGTFEFARVAAGDYVLYDDPGNPSRPQLRGHQKITVAGDDIDGLVLKVGPGLEVPGKFVMDERGAPLPDVSAIRLSLYTDDPLLHDSVYAQISRQEGGAFKVGNLESGVYRVSAEKLPAGFYVKTIRFAGKDVMNRDIDLTQNLAGKILEIQLSPHAAEITGVARDAQGKVLDHVDVILRGPGRAVALLATTDERGAFRFQNLAPGDYRIGATADQYQSDGEFDAQAARLTLTEDSSVAIAPPLIVHKPAE